MLDPQQVRAAEASASPNQHLYPPQEPSAVRDPAVSATPLAQDLGWQKPGNALIMTR